MAVHTEPRLAKWWGWGEMYRESYTEDPHDQYSILSTWQIFCQESTYTTFSLPRANHLSHYSLESSDHNDFLHDVFPRDVTTAETSWREDKGLLDLQPMKTVITVLLWWHRLCLVSINMDHSWPQSLLWSFLARRTSSICTASGETVLFCSSEFSFC